MIKNAENFHKTIAAVKKNNRRYIEMCVSRICGIKKLLFRFFVDLKAQEKSKNGV